MHRIHSAESKPETEGRVIGWASRYDMLVQVLTLGRAAAIRERTLDVAQIKSGDSVLDVGCGTGDLTIRAKARVGAAGRVQGIDAAPGMVAVARQKGAQAEIDVDFRAGVIEALPFPDDHFDAVLSSLMMHHLPDALKQRGLAEIYRVLKPDGTVTIVDFRRPTSLPGKILTTLMLHGAMETGVQDLPTVLAGAGFGQLAEGNVGFGPLGFIRARAHKP